MMKLGPGFCGTLLTITFVIAKITDYVDWSWWLVFAPIWIGWALVIAVVGIILGFAVMSAVMDL